MVDNEKQSIVTRIRKLRSSFFAPIVTSLSAICTALGILSAQATTETSELLVVLVGSISVVVTIITSLLYYILRIGKRRREVSEQLEERKKTLVDYYKEIDIIEKPIQQELSKLETIQIVKKPEDAKLVLDRIDTITLKKWFLLEKTDDQARILGGLEKQLEILSKVHTDYNQGLSQIVTMILTFSAFMFIIIGLLWDTEILIQMILIIKIVLAAVVILVITPLILIMLSHFRVIIPSKEKEHTRFELEGLKLDPKLKKTANEILFDQYSGEIRRLNDEYEIRKRRLVNTKRMVTYYIFMLLIFTILVVVLFSGIV